MESLCQPNKGDIEFVCHIENAISCSRAHCINAELPGGCDGFVSGQDGTDAYFFE